MVRETREMKETEKKNMETGTADRAPHTRTMHCLLGKSHNARGGNCTNVCVRCVCECVCVCFVCCSFAAMAVIKIIA